MHIQLKGIESPKNDDVLWRYMDFEKFVNLLATQSLFFTRADKFEDPYEGLMPPAVKNVFKNETYRVEREKYGPEAEGAHLKLIENLRKYVMCNCWYHAKEESMGMWQKHHMHKGIAIKTTMGKLKESLPTCPNVFIGKIKYIDHATFDVPQILSEMRMMYVWYFYKRKAFEYESEVRVIIDPNQYIDDYFPQPMSVKSILESDAPDICPVGMAYNVNVKTLIEEVITSPYTADWVTETIRLVIQKYGFDFKVDSSKLLDAPDLN